MGLHVCQFQIVLLRHDPRIDNPVLIQIVKVITRGRIRTFKELACTLKSMGLEVTPANIEDALAVLYQQGL